MLVRWLTLVAGLAVLPAIGIADGTAPPPQFAGPITVYKSPTCGCCGNWVDYLRADGFRVTVIDRENMTEVKEKYGVGPALRSCHTAVVDGYVVEGHVPARDIRRLLSERPDVAGLTAPGMPQMSPGMLSIEPRGYDVLTFDDEGRTRVFSRY